MNKTQALLVAVAFVPLGAVGVVAIHFGRGALRAERFREHLAELDASGVLPPELELEPATSSEAGQIRGELARVRAALGQAQFGRSDLDALSILEPDWNAADLARVEQWVALRGEFYDAVDDLTSNRIAREAAETGERVISQALKLVELRRVVYPLVIRARLQAARGEHERAARNFTQGMVLVKLSGDGTMVGGMIGISVRGFLWREAAGLVQAGILDPRALLATLGPELQSSFDAAEVERILRVELARLRGSEPTRPSFDDGALSFLEYPEEAERMVAGLERRERCLGLPSLQGEEFERERLALLEALADGDPLQVSIVVGFVTTARQERSFEVLFRVALAAYAYHLSEGEWPGSLAPLAPFLDGTVPDDPWTGKPFRYVHKEECWRLGPAGGALEEDLEVQLRRHQIYDLK